MNERSAALVGYGKWGKNIGRNLYELGALHTICDALPIPPQSGIHTTSDFSTLLSNPEIKQLFIATPPSTHYALAKQALLAGKDLFIEKPLCLDFAEGEDLVNLANEQGLVLMVGHLLHYHPCVRKIKELVFAGVLGDLRYISAHRIFPGYIREENVLWDLLPHDISVILSLCKTYPESHYCNGTALHETMDTLSVSLKFPGNIQADIVASWVYPFKEQKLTLIGTKGALVFDDTKDWPEKLNLQMLKPLYPKMEYERIECHVEREEPLKAECQHFLTCCEKREMPLTSGEESLQCLRLLQQLDSRSSLVIN